MNPVQTPAQSQGIAYFSMEIGLQAAMPTYSGGLGVLAGDTLHSAADLGLPMVAVSLLYSRGYFRQSIGPAGRQQEEAVTWYPEEFCQRLNQSVSVTIEGRPVRVGAYRYDVMGEGGHKVPVYFLHTHFPENSAWDQDLTGFLYGGDERYRLCQEAILGIGGVLLLREIGYGIEGTKAPRREANAYPGPAANAAADIGTFHMNEGHAALLTFALLDTGLSAAQTRSLCVFTTHTPVPAGHDTFSAELVGQVLGQAAWERAQRLEACPGDRLNMSYLAMNLSRYVNGVAKRHMEVSRALLSNAAIAGVTNGVHAGRWVAPAIGSLFDKHLAGWRQDNSYLRWAWELPLDELRAARRDAKADLFRRIEALTGEEFSLDAFTIGFARRATPYKRMDILFQDIPRLKRVAEATGPLQLVFAGKAHPRDLGGKDAIVAVHAAMKELSGSGVRLVFLPNYDLELGLLITSGVDLWLNNPVKPLEASGTSGMKAALNGVPSFSTLDGWWVEGCLEGITGWEIDDREDGMVAGSNQDLPAIRSGTAAGLYDKLESTIMPAYYEQQGAAWAPIMRQAIALNASFFNTHRMVAQYQLNAYRGRPS